MNIDTLNRWLTPATNVGVIIGLAFVVYEVRQNTVSLDNEADVAVWSIGAEQATLIVESAEVAELLAKAETEEWTSFSRVEQIRLEVLWGSLVDRLELQFRLWKRRGEELGLDSIVFPSQFFKLAIFRTWWSAQLDYQPDFVEFFDALIAESGGDA